jgi:hypothetical protein
MPQPFREFDHKDPIEDTWVGVTGKQVNYIGILSNDLGYNLSTRNRIISDFLHLKSNLPFDIWSLSRDMASQVISEFKKRKEELKGSSK